MVRDGGVVDIAMRDVVLDDVLEIGPGDQVVVDGDVLQSASLEVDESLLTGESETVPKPLGSPIMSGSFVSAGTGRYQATKVGREAYAVALAEEARRFTLVRSELRSGIDTIITYAIYGMVPTAVLLLVSQLQASDSVSEALRTSVGGVVAMVPEGLVLLTSVAFAVGVVRLGRVNVLVQELPAVEGLARVDVLCLDKTGTLTEGAIAVHSVETIGDAGAAGDAVQQALGAFAAADPSPNATALALREAFPLPVGWQPTGAIPFASVRKWSAVHFAEQGSWFLGAPDVLLPVAHAADADLDARVTARVEEQARAGRRVVLLASSPQPLNGDGPPADLAPRALVLLEDKIRPEAADTLAYFAEQGVTIKVISGDHPATVGAVARRCGIEDDDPVDARTLPEDPSRLGVAVEASTVFGRVTPHQKREMVKALQARGHVVAMTGDGVNDVLALKDADIGIAMGAGSTAARAVAQLVLLDNSFATLPGAVAEGRQVINNLERVANLFVTKTVYSMMIAIAVGITVVPFPFLPRHLTLVGALTIGIPSFFLALAPSSRAGQVGVREARAGVRDPRRHHRRRGHVHGLRPHSGRRRDHARPGADDRGDGAHGSGPRDPRSSRAASRRVAAHLGAFDARRVHRGARRPTAARLLRSLDATGHRRVRVHRAHEPRCPSPHARGARARPLRLAGAEPRRRGRRRAPR